MCVIKVKFPGNFLFVYLGATNVKNIFFSWWNVLTESTKETCMKITVSCLNSVFLI